MSGWFWTQDEWAEWSNDLASLIPEDDVSRYANPDGAQESIIEACLRAYVSERAALDALVAERVAALADDEALIRRAQAIWWDRGGRGGWPPLLRALAAALTERRPT